MTDNELQAIEARANAATPGEWRATRNSSDAATVHLAPTLAFDTEIALLRDFAENEGDPARDFLMPDAEFIAAARSDVPALVLEVRRLRGLIKAGELGAVEHAGSWVCPWCEAVMADDSQGVCGIPLDRDRRHAPECPAFTEDGSVR